jgi:hypothetical protein
VSGYVHCACRDCFETAVGTAPALCWECDEAGCSPDGECSCDVEREPEEPEPPPSDDGKRGPGHSLD